MLEDTPRTQLYTTKTKAYSKSQTPVNFLIFNYINNRTVLLLDRSIKSTRGLIMNNHKLYKTQTMIQIQLLVIDLSTLLIMLQEVFNHTVKVRCLLSNKSNLTTILRNLPAKVKLTKIETSVALRKILQKKDVLQWA